MNDVKRLIALTILMVLSLPVAAATVPAYETGNQLLTLCESKGGSSEGVCIGYIEGVSDASEGKTWDGTPYCAPKGATNGQLVKIVTKYLNDHPEHLHLSAHSIVQQALLEAFPCT